MIEILEEASMDNNNDDEQTGIVIICNECGTDIRAGSVCADCALKGWTG